MRAFVATGLLVLLGCPLPNNVLYRCEANGSCAISGQTCGKDGYCHPKADAGGECVPRDVPALCAAVECGFVDDGCGKQYDC